MSSGSLTTQFGGGLTIRCSRPPTAAAELRALGASTHITGTEMFGIQHFEIFLVASIALNLTPGPDTFYVLGRGIAQGRKVGIASALGISAGSLVHTFVAALGLSAIIAASATLFLAIKFAGAAYLIFLGCRMLLSRATEASIATSFNNSSFAAAFKQGLITNALNPKVALFFLAFLPQFISADSQSKPIAFLILGISFVITNTIWCLCLAWFSSTVSSRARRNPTYLQYLNRVVGGLLVALGVRLATSK